MLQLLLYILSLPFKFLDSFWKLFWLVVGSMTLLIAYQIPTIKQYADPVVLPTITTIKPIAQRAQQTLGLAPKPKPKPKPPTLYNQLMNVAQKGLQGIWRLSIQAASRVGNRLLDVVISPTTLAVAIAYIYATTQLGISINVNPH